MKLNIRADAEQCQLAIIDMQDRLCQQMLKSDLDEVIDNCSNLTLAANILEIPTIVTEQSPVTDGRTVTNIAEHFDGKPIPKFCVSAVKEHAFRTGLLNEKPQVVLVGQEAHLGILKTAQSLAATGRLVFVVEDAVISSGVADKAAAIESLAREGIALITDTESLLLDWIETAHPEAVQELVDVMEEEFA